MRERLAMVAVYALVFLVLPVLIFGPAIYAEHHDSVAFSQPVRESPSPVLANPDGLALHSHHEVAP